MPFIGQIMPWAPNFAPRNWAFCNGELIQKSQNEALFNLLGDKYGGDGVTTFALPDLQGRVIMGAGRGYGLTNRSLGEMGGMETVVLTKEQLPAHSHTFQIPATSNRATTDNPVGNVPAKGDMDLYASTGSPSPNITLPATGGNQPVSVMQPYTVLHYVICLNGSLPSAT
jgi:microcystin-dependent protein